MRHIRCNGAMIDILNTSRSRPHPNSLWGVFKHKGYTQTIQIDHEQKWIQLTQKHHICAITYNLQVSIESKIEK